MAASPALENEMEAASTIREVNAHGGVILIAADGQLHVRSYDGMIVPLPLLERVFVYRYQIRVLLARAAEQ